MQTGVISGFKFKGPSKNSGGPPYIFHLGYALAILYALHNRTFPLIMFAPMVQVDVDSAALHLVKRFFKFITLRT